MRRRAFLLAAALASVSRLERLARASAAPDTDEDAVAEWLSGTRTPIGSTPTREWLDYAALEDERWERERPRIQAMRDWSTREIAPLVPPRSPVFYPFGGPDALHALALFPDAESLLLVGLEPVFPLSEASRGANPGYFSGLGATMAELHRLTFFRTQDLVSASGAGVLPVLLATLVRMGGRVTRISPPLGGNLTIDWVAEGGRPRRLDYAQVDLSNAGLARRTDFVAKLRERGAVAPNVTFVKAASYLLHEERFSYLRRLVLEESAALVQDDTGIPFRDLREPGAWTVRLFGRYVPPAEPFEDRLQADLATAFSHPVRPALPFGIGYHVDARHSNLLVGARLPR